MTKIVAVRGPFIALALVVLASVLFIVSIAASLSAGWNLALRLAAIIVALAAAAMLFVISSQRGR
jgi:hypothetical protein